MRSKHVHQSFPHHYYPIEHTGQEHSLKVFLFQSHYKPGMAMQTFYVTRQDSFLLIIRESKL